MSEAADKLARSRQALVEQMARRQRHHDPREQRAAPGAEAFQGFDEEAGAEPPPAGGGWLGHLTYVVRTWWRYHPAHMAVDLATPVMQQYARRKPAQMLGIAFGLGAALTFARPWRLISIGTLLVALLKSSQLSQLAMAAMSAADYRKDHSRPE